MLLLVLGRLHRGQRQLPFTECETALSALLRAFGPGAKTLHPEYPFWRLQHDGLWVVSASRHVALRSPRHDPTKAELRAAQAVGQLASDALMALDGSPERLDQAAQVLLDDNFPTTLHADIRAAVGLDELDVADAARHRRRRDPHFRQAVLQAYGFRCAVCALDLRMGELSLGLEAAHIQWHMAHGPDSIDNGLALCAMHHKLFDLGALTVADGHQIWVSDHVQGGERFEEVLMRHHAQPLQGPILPEHRPAPPYVAWHRAQVFKGQPSSGR
nr:HNH endonuclease [Ideonella livida]